jgi:transcription initiation factor TFIID TATA-box-binding protein
MTIEIANIVGSGSLHRELKLEALESDLSTAYLEHDPSNYHGLYVRLVEDGPLITVYRSGKYIVTGATSFDELRETSEVFLRNLVQLGILDESPETGFTAQNVVCTEELPSEVDLTALSIGLGLESVEYEPEQFPGLIYRPTELPAVVLVFANGKVVITGAPDVETAEKTFESLQTQVDRYLPG